MHLSGKLNGLMIWRCVLMRYWGMWGETHWVQRPGNSIGEEFKSYLSLWDARDVSSGPGLAADFPCGFRAGIQKGFGIDRKVAGSNFSPLRLCLVGFWIPHLFTLNQEWTCFLGYREKLRTNVFIYRRNPDTVMMKSHEMPKSQTHQAFLLQSE